MANNKKAILQIALTEKVYAYQLHGLVFLIDDLYTSYTWLERAEQHNGLQPYGDFEFNVEDLLVVKKLEIGTPNFIELHGWVEPLLTTLTYLGGVGGIIQMLESGSNIYKNWLDGRKEGKSEHEKAMEALALEKAKLENQLLIEDINRAKILNQRMQSPHEKALALHEMGKVSEYALNFKGISQANVDLQIQKGVLETAIHINIIRD